MRNLKAFLANLPHHAGVYQMLDEKGEVIYVGKAKDLKKRVSSYFSGRAKDPKTLSLLKHISDIDITVATSENEAVLLECNLIKKLRPRYNILLRDDKSYPYIFISNHDYPRIDLYRGARKKNGRYFGPYPSSLAVRETISLLQKLFHLRTCTDTFYETRSRPCLLYQIGRCSGPCVGLIPQEEYARNIQMAVMFLEGKSNKIVELLQQRMETASAEQQFELAAHYRDQINRLRQIQNPQYVNVSDGEADILGFAAQAGIYCLQLLTIRGGQVLGSRAYFPVVPEHTEKAEILSSFISQHYLHDATHIESTPRHIIVDVKLADAELLENALTQLAKRQVKLHIPTRGERKKWLAMATTSARQSLAAQLMSKINMQERVIALQQALNMKKMPARIECFDISHSSGEATVASCVVFNREGPVKADYRRYNITDITPGDDVAAMRQVLWRRFKKRKQEETKRRPGESRDPVFPDLILIDGGKAQLGAAITVMEELEITHLLLVGVSKGPDRKAGFETLHRHNEAPLHLAADSVALHFIQQIRDEAHRFAITGHRQRRDKARRQSTLEFIPGIGAKRRRELLRYFGGIQGIAHASLDELEKVPGISRQLAEKIFAALHDATF